MNILSFRHVEKSGVSERWNGSPTPCRCHSANRQDGGPSSLSPYRKLRSLQGRDWPQLGDENVFVDNLIDRFFACLLLADAPAPAPAPAACGGRKWTVGVARNKASWQGTAGGNLVNLAGNCTFGPEAPTLARTDKGNWKAAAE